MSGKRYPEEFKIAAVKQVAHGGHPVSEIAQRQRLGVSIQAEEMADLFILKHYRRQGLAFETVHALARTFTGPWLVAVFRADIRASAFWQRLFASLPPNSVRSYNDPNLPDLLQHAINDTDSQAPSTISTT